MKERKKSSLGISQLTKIKGKTNKKYFNDFCLKKRIKNKLFSKFDFSSFYLISFGSVMFTKFLRIMSRIKIASDRFYS